MGCAGSTENVAREAGAPNVTYESGKTYENWSLQVVAEGTTMAYPKTSAEAVAVVNHALKDKKRVRVIGHQHNWSPITISPQDENDVKTVVLMSLKQLEKEFDVVEKDQRRAAGKPTATVSLGCGQEEFLALLEAAARDATGSDKSAPGFGISHCPAPDKLTMGGMVAINGHGTAIPNPEDRKHLSAPEDASYGSWSNRLVALKAIVWNGEKKEYEEREFLRSTNGGNDIAPLLTSIGRAVLTYGTFQVEPNYYMRCRSFMGIDWKDMFADTDADGTPKEKSMAWFMERHGRVEAIWYPFTDKPWLKVWTVTDNKKPAKSQEVTEVCNYPFSDQLPEFLTSLVKLMTGSLADTAVKIGINDTINTITLADAMGAKAEQRKEYADAFDHSDEITADEAGITADDSAEEQQRKKDAAGKARLEKTDLGKKLVQEGEEMNKLIQGVKAGEGVTKVDGEDEAEGEWYEAEEGQPLEGASWDGAEPGWEDLSKLWRWGGLTPYLSRAIYARTVAGLKANHSFDIWGPSKNTLIYVRDTTVKVTANGYAILCNRKHVGHVMHEFATMFQSMLDEYRSKDVGNFDAYPIAMPLEIRVTGVDDPTPIGDGSSCSPPLSALYVSPEDRAAGFDSCLWLDCLSLPGNWGSNAFYHDMEKRLCQHPTFNSDKAKLRPEWSKGWGYAAKEGAWFDAEFMKLTRASLPEWNAAHATLDSYDVGDLFRNKWMDNMFRTVDGAGRGITDAEETKQKEESAAKEQEQEADAAVAADDEKKADEVEEAPAAAEEEKAAEAEAPAAAAEEAPAAAAEEAPAADNADEAAPAAQDEKAAEDEKPAEE